MPRQRLNKILAQAGLSSRRGADRLITDGHVAVNGAVTRELATLADPAVDRITVDGRPLPAAEALHYVALHKPGGYVTTVRDPHGRPVVTELVDVGVRLYPVGRLDWDVEGLLLLTNDGPLTHRLLHPRYGLPRVYDVEVTGRVAREELPRWRQGAHLDDGPAVPLAVELLGHAREGTRLRGRGHRSQARSGGVRRGLTPACAPSKRCPIIRGILERTGQEFPWTWAIGAPGSTT